MDIGEFTVRSDEVLPAYTTSAFPGTKTAATPCGLEAMVQVQLVKSYGRII
jgi:hypothetical protein